MTYERVSATGGAKQMRADLVDQLVARHRKPTRLLFELLQKPQPLRSGQHVIGQLEHTADRIVQRVEAAPRSAPGYSKSRSNATGQHRQESAHKPALWTNPELWTTTDAAPPKPLKPKRQK